MPTQLRIYTIKQNRLRDFVKEWKETVLPLRREHGFEITQAWVVEPSNQFIWVINYDGSESWKSKEEQYYASSERKKIQPNPARLIAKSEQYFIEGVL